MKKIICLSLCVCLIFSLAQPAYALDPLSVSIEAMNFLNIANSLVFGMGIKPQANAFNSYNTVVSSIADYISSATYDGLNFIYKIRTRDGLKTFIDSAIISAARSALLLKNFIQVKSTFPDEHVLNYYGEDVTLSNITAPIDEVRFSYLYYGNYYECIYWVSANTFLYNGNRISNSVYSSETFYYSSSRSPRISSASDVDFVTYPYIGQPTNLLVDLDHYLVNFVNYGHEYEPVGNIGFSDVAPSLDKSIAENYPDWAEKSITIPAGTVIGDREFVEDTPLFPINISPYSGSDTYETRDDAINGDVVDSDVGIGDYSGILGSIGNALDSIKAGITGFWNDTKAFFSSIGTKVDTMISSLAAIAASVGQDLFNGVSSILDLLRSWSASAVDFFSRSWVNFTSAAQNAWTSITSILLDILNGFKSLSADIVQAIISALSALFVPDVAEISAAVDTMKARFPFFDSIIGTWKQFQLVLSGGPPVIYAHLENAEGQFNYGGTVAILDMNFYTRYKSIGDAVLSAALWAFFAWRTFVKLPGLISGASGDVAVIDEVSKKW